MVSVNLLLVKYVQALIRKMRSLRSIAYNDQYRLYVAFVHSENYIEKLEIRYTVKVIQFNLYTIFRGA